MTTLDIVSAGTENEMHSNVMPRTEFNGGGWELSPKNTFLHVGWMGGTPFHMYDFIILMLWPNVRASVPTYLDICHLYCCAIEYIVARSINAHVLYCRERERI